MSTWSADSVKNKRCLTILREIVATPQRDLRLKSALETLSQIPLQSYADIEHQSVFILAVTTAALHPEQYSLDPDKASEDFCEHGNNISTDSCLKCNLVHFQNLIVEDIQEIEKIIGEPAK